MSLEERDFEGGRKTEMEGGGIKRGRERGQKGKLKGRKGNSTEGWE